MKKYITNCTKCWREIRILFDPPVKQINCIELECCSGPTKIKKSVLIVDDDVKILSMLAKMFKKLGFEVSISSNENQALDLINTKKIFDIVISDLNLGNSDGLTLLHKIRKQRPSIKTILMSGDSLSEDEIHLISIDDFLAKPFELEELKRTVQKVLET